MSFGGPASTAEGGMADATSREEGPVAHAPFLIEEEPEPKRLR
jgi:hypothetical protein